MVLTQFCLVMAIFHHLSISRLKSQFAGKNVFLRDTRHGANRTLRFELYIIKGKRLEEQKGEEEEEEEEEEVEEELEEELEENGQGLGRESLARSVARRWMPRMLQDT